MSAGLGRIFPCRSSSIRATTTTATTQRFTRTQHVHVHTHRRHAALTSTHVRPTAGTVARTSTPAGANPSAHTPFAPFSTSYKPTSSLREAFDAPAASSSRSRYAAASASAPDGLFLYPNLRTPDTFLDSVNAAIARGHLLVERIANAPANGDEEMRKVIKLFDRLSDVLCKVIDAAEVVRCLHPDTHWRQGAERVYEELFSWMNTLNTDPRLYE
ncbi:Mitochondrial intermediate peptidase, partial [Podila minutissima]